MLTYTPSYWRKANSLAVHVQVQPREK